jgi:hypothetical protein
MSQRLVSVDQVARPAQGSAVAVWLVPFLVAGAWPFVAALMSAAVALPLRLLGVDVLPGTLVSIGTLLCALSVAPLLGHALLAPRAIARGVPGNHHARAAVAEVAGTVVGGVPLAVVALVLFRAFSQHPYVR